MATYNLAVCMGRKQCSSSLLLSKDQLLGMGEGQDHQVSFAVPTHPGSPKSVSLGAIRRHIKACDCSRGKEVVVRAHSQECCEQICGLAANSWACSGRVTCPLYLAGASSPLYWYLGVLTS